MADYYRVFPKDFGKIAVRVLCIKQDVPCEKRHPRASVIFEPCSGYTSAGGGAAFLFQLPKKSRDVLKYLPIGQKIDLFVLV